MQAIFLNGKNIKIKFSVKIKEIIEYLHNIKMKESFIEGMLPWGHIVIIESGETDKSVYITLETKEFENALEYMNLISKISRSLIEDIKKNYELNFGNLERFNLYRQDDNSNIFLIKTYSSSRVANYFKQIFEERGHKQMYWVEQSK